MLNDAINQMENLDPQQQQQQQSQAQSNSTPSTKHKPDEQNQPLVGDVEKNPVFDSIARYLGIDLSTEGRAARNRRGVAMIVHGPPLSGKSRAAVALAKYYECALLTIDSIIIDAISGSSSTAAARARQFCAEAAAKYAEETRGLDVDQSRTNLNANFAPPAGLSVEALAQHSMSQGGAQGGAKRPRLRAIHTQILNRIKRLKQTHQTSIKPLTIRPPRLLYSALWHEN